MRTNTLKIVKDVRLDTLDTSTAQMYERKRDKRGYNHHKKKQTTL